MTRSTTARTSADGMGRRRAQASVERPARSTKSARVNQLKSQRRKRWFWVAGITAALVFIIWVIFSSSLLSVSRVQVNGTGAVSAAQIRQASGVETGTPLARLNSDAIAAKVKKIPAIATAKVKLNWPHEVVITVVERSAVVTVMIDGEPWVVDRTGTPYMPVSELPGGKVNAVPPLSVKSPGPGDLATRSAVQIVEAVPPDIRATIASVDAISPAKISFKLTDGRTIIWGTPDQSARKGSLLPALLSHDGSVFDISTPNQIVIS